MQKYGIFLSHLKILLNTAKWFLFFLCASRDQKVIQNFNVLSLFELSEDFFKIGYMFSLKFWHTMPNAINLSVFKKILNFSLSLMCNISSTIYILQTYICFNPRLLSFLSVLDIKILRNWSKESFISISLKRYWIHNEKRTNDDLK